MIDRSMVVPALLGTPVRSPHSGHSIGNVQDWRVGSVRIVSLTLGRVTRPAEASNPDDY